MSIGPDRACVQFPEFANGDENATVPVLHWWDKIYQAKTSDKWRTKWATVLDESRDMVGGEVIDPFIVNLNAADSKWSLFERLMQFTDADMNITMPTV